jgi:catechol 2,3-dioxygenase-like lactoylglutathione lyase family enzyme
MTRARLLTGFFWFMLCAVALFAQPSRITGVEAVGITVANLDRSVEFYTHTLHFQKESEVELSGVAVEHLKGLFGVRMRIARLRLGGEELELSEYLAPQGRPLPQDSHSNDLWFQHVAIVVSNMDDAYRWLRQHHVQHVSSGPQTLPSWNRNAAGIQAFYFRDPDGHVLEVIHFPPGKGDPRWQRGETDLFLGIDHTAIAVSNTDTSLLFYRDQLGMRVTGNSENYGEEQEHLNNVFGAHLRITSLRASRGPGIELLEYLAPHSGREIPQDARANDIAHWETLVDNDDPAAAWAEFSHAHVRLISNNITTVNDRGGFMLADPDGHVIEAINTPRSAVSKSKEGGRWQLKNND